MQSCRDRSGGDLARIGATCFYGILTSGGGRHADESRTRGTTKQDANQIARIRDAHLDLSITEICVGVGGEHIQAFPDLPTSRDVRPVPNSDIALRPLREDTEMVFRIDLVQVRAT